MILASGDTYSKTFFGQNDFSVSISYSAISDHTISFVDSDSLYKSFSFESGKVFDFNDNFLYLYNSEEPLFLEINYRTGLYTCFVNNKLMCASRESIFTGQYITGLRVWNVESDLSYNLSIYGEQPDLTFSSLSTDDLITYTGTIDSTREIRLLSSFGTYSSISDETLYPNTQVTYVTSGNGMQSGGFEDIIFNFDFGSITERVFASYIDTGINSSSYSVFFDEQKTESIHSETGLKKVFYNNFGITYNIDSSLDIGIKLLHIGRLSYTPITGTGVGIGNFSGLVVGSGLIYSSNCTGHIYPGGFPGTGAASTFVYATGEIIYEYLIDVVGYEGPNLSTGVLFGEVTGVVGPGSGNFHFLNQIVGTPSVSVYYGGVNTTPIGLYTGNIDDIVILTRYIEGVYSSDFTGVGVNTNSTGSIYNYDLLTGDYINIFNYGYESGSEFVSLSNDGIVTSNSISGIITLQPNVGYIGGRVTYEVSDTDIIDYSTLSIYTDIENYEFKITHIA